MLYSAAISALTKRKVLQNILHMHKLRKKFWMRQHNKGLPGNMSVLSTFCRCMSRVLCSIRDMHAAGQALLLRRPRPFFKA